MISGIKDKELDKLVNALPFIAERGSGYYYKPGFYNYVRDCAPKKLFDNMDSMCSTYHVNEMSNDEIIALMNELWDKWIEYNGNSEPKPDWLSNNDDYIDLDDIVL